MIRFIDCVISCLLFSSQFALPMNHGKLVDNDGKAVVHKQADLFPILESLDTDKGTASCESVSLLKPSTNIFEKDYAFANIGHLELNVDGPFTLHYTLKAPTLTLRVNGPLTLGKSNEEMGILAATHGPLNVEARSIDARFGKFYGKGPTMIESTRGDITIGAPTRGIDEEINRQYIERTWPWLAEWNASIAALGVPPQVGYVEFDSTLNRQNEAYAASDDVLTLKSSSNIFINYGSVISSVEDRLTAKHEINNLSGKISSHGSTTIEADNYNHLRDAPVNKSRSRDYAQFPGSGPAILESLGKIYFRIKNKIHNLAGSIRSGSDILVNDTPLIADENPAYIEEIQNFYNHGNYNVNGNPDAWAYQYFLTFSQSCITQAGGIIKMNLGDFSITGNMNARSVNLSGNIGAFTNNELSRGVTSTKPIVQSLTQFVLQEAQQSGMHTIAADGSVQTDFPLGTASIIDPNNMVLLENNFKAPVHWKSIFNPLGSINLDLFVQRMLGTYAGRAEGRDVCSRLWKNTGLWRQDNDGRDTMTQEDIANIKRSMLLSYIDSDDTIEQQQLLLCIAPEDINPFQAPGDISAENFSCTTKGDQAHCNNRIIATGPEGIKLKSIEGNVNLETQSYTVVTETEERKVIEQRAMPQQQLIAYAGPVVVDANKNITRTGSLIVGATDVTEHVELGSLTKNPLILQTTVENHHSKDGFFSSSHWTDTSLTHSAVVSATHAGSVLHDKAATTITAVAPDDVAGQEIIYDAPETRIEGLLCANRRATSREKNGAFTDEHHETTEETPFAIPAHIQAPRVRLLGKDAQINANIIAHELHDETENGARFVAKIAQMLCSKQSIIDSPLMSVDSGYVAGYETMIPPLLMVEKIVRLQDHGHMLFESALIDKEYTEIIGDFVEATYHLKQWQKSWHHTSQFISDEVLVLAAFAIAIFTDGMGVELLSSVLQNITAATGMQLSAAGVAMVNAGFTALCCDAGASFLKTGDITAVIEQVVSPAYLKSTAITMASAGLLHTLAPNLNVNLGKGYKPFVSHLKEHALRHAVRGGLSIVTGIDDVDKTLAKILKGLPLDAVAAYVSNNIGALYRDKEIDYGIHKIAHAILGGASGWANNGTRAGLIAGAQAGLSAEIVGEALLAEVNEISEAAVESLIKQGKPLSDENLSVAIESEMHRRAELAKLAAGTLAVLTNNDVEISLKVAANAVDNNALPLAMVAIAPEALAAAQAILAGSLTALLAKDQIDTHFRKKHGERKARAELANQGNAAASMPDPDDNPDDKGKEKEKAEYENLDKYSVKVKGNLPTRKDPRTGKMIVRNTNPQGHGECYWKLKDRFGNRIASLTKEGKYLRK